MITRTLVLIVAIVVLGAGPASAGLLGSPLNLKFTLHPATGDIDSKSGEPADLGPPLARDSVGTSYIIWC